ncbi:hypothetical protein GGH94_004608 [Coemansia aciculifera]|uniref:Threonylcarbamoyl-AMP synthase n=1 Tax=Coemansia aciculifera TaxID=417176 RepID=A0A9W8M3X8_9FUNG|nr:hypothetical protein GGH94_004608 [Coemansia aciculifera]
MSPTLTDHFNTRLIEAIDADHLQFPGGIEDSRFTATAKATDTWISASRHELRLNRSIAIPTETVYGLAANALDSNAVSTIFSAKGRPSDNPLIVHVSSVRMLRSLYHLPASDPTAGSEDAPFLGTDDASLESTWLRQRLLDAEEEDRRNGGDGVWPEIPRIYHSAIRKFWPGALTIVVPRPACIPLAVIGGHGSTVAVRFPSHPVARAIIAACGLPLAAPSANASGRPSPTTAAHVSHDLGGRIPLIIDGGACAVGVESTVVDAHSATAHVEGHLSPCVLRPGGVTVEALRSLGGDTWGERLRVYRRDFSSAELERAPTTPGMKYRHYSPTAPVYLFKGGNQAMQQCINKMSCAKIGIVIVTPITLRAPESCTLTVHCVDDARDLAKRIFALLRALDETDHVDCILVQGVDDKHEGLAVMNRLEKAASHIVTL